MLSNLIVKIISLQARAARGVHHIHKNEMILQADKDAIMAATFGAQWNQNAVRKG